MKTNMVILVIAVALSIGFGSGYLFRNYQLSKMRNNFLGRVSQPQQNIGDVQEPRRIRPVEGQIISLDERSITIKLADQSSKMVVISDNTKINQLISGAKSDLIEGKIVSIVGSENSDGSVTAQTITFSQTEK